MRRRSWVELTAGAPSRCSQPVHRPSAPYGDCVVFSPPFPTHSNWVAAGLFDKMKALASRRSLSDLTVGPVLSWTTQAIMDHTQRLLSIPGEAAVARVRPPASICYATARERSAWAVRKGHGHSKGHGHRRTRGHGVAYAQGHKGHGVCPWLTGAAYGTGA